MKNMNMKKIAALMVFVTVFAVSTPAMAGYRTGSPAGDGIVYGAGGAAVGAGSFVAVAWLLSWACPPVAVASAAVVGGAYLGWYGATDPNKDFVKDVEKTATAGSLAVTAGLAAAGEAALQAAW